VYDHEIIIGCLIQLHNFFVNIDDGDVINASILVLNIVLGPKKLDKSGSAEHHQLF